MKHCSLLFLVLIILLSVFPVMADDGDFVIDANGVLTEYHGNDENVEIPDTVKKIGNGVFKDNETMRYVSIPWSVEEIDAEAFKHTHLVEVYIPGSVKAIRYGAFAENYYMNIIGLQEGLEIIGAEAFFDTPEVESIQIPNSVNEIEFIGGSPFNSRISVYEGSYAHTWAMEHDWGHSVVGWGDFTIVGDVLYGYSGGANELIIPGNVKRIAQHAVHKNLNVKSVIIPESVTKIDDCAFSECHELEHISFPDTLTEIGGWAFSSCDSLTEIDLPSGLKTIEGGLFNGCSGLYRVNIPGSVKSIREMAFNETWNLERVTIPSSVTEIADDSFCPVNMLVVESGSYAENWARSHGQRFYVNGSSSFTIVDGVLVNYSGSDANVTIPSSVKKIGDNAFRLNSTMKQVTIPNGVTEIGAGAFIACAQLETVNIPGSVKTIGWGAFAECPALNKVTIPSGVETVDAMVFVFCENLDEVIFPDSVTSIGEDVISTRTIITANPGSYASDYAVENGFKLHLTNSGEFTIIDGRLLSYTGKDENIVIPANKNIWAIGPHAFEENENITSVVIPEGVTRIDDYAFAYSVNLVSVTLPESLKTIGYRAFFHCDSLNDVELPLGLEDMDAGVFDYTALRSITIPAGVKFIASFYMCKNLESVTFLGSPDQIGWNAFYGDSSLKSINLPDSIKLIEDWAFAESGLESITLPASIDTIHYGVFAGTQLREINIPNTIKLIRAEAFKECPNLEKVTIAGSVKTIEYGAFAFDHAVTSVTLNEGLERIENRAFYECYSLYDLFVPKSVNYISDDDALHHSVKISAYKNSYAAQWAIEHNWGLRYVDGADDFLIVNGILYSYNGDAAAVTIPSTVKELAINAFTNNKNLKSVKIPSSVEIIGWGAFMDCTNLESVEIPNSVTRIDDYAFGWCKSLSSIQIPTGIDRLNEGVFAGSGLTSLTVPGNVKSVGSNVVNDCRALESIVLEKGVESIEYRAFYIGNGDNSLKSITLPEGLKVISNEAFQTAYQVPSLKIPASVEYIEGAPFNVGISLIVTKGSYAEQWAKDNGFGYRYESSTDWLIEDGVLYSYSGTASTITIPSNVKQIARNAMSHNENLVNVTIPTGVESIGGGAFADCVNIEKIVIPDTVNYIGEYAFDGLVKMTSVHIPNGISEILEGTFVGTGLTSVTIPEGVTVIGDAAFNWTSDLTKVSLPSTLTFIGNDAFANSHKMESITIPASVTWLAEDSKDAFSWGTTIYVYPGSRAESWAREVGQRFQYVGATGDFNIIDGILYSYTGKAEKVVIPSTVKTIGKSAFAGAAMKQVTIPESVTFIDAYAFERCANLESVTIPSGVTEILGGTFYGNTALKSVTLPANLTAIWSAAFGGCTSLTSIVIPENVGVIWRAFVGCDNLTDITIPASVSEMDDDAIPVTAVIHTEKGSYAAEWGLAHGNKVVYDGEKPDVKKFSIFYLNDFGEYVLADSALTLDAADKDAKLQLAAVAPEGDPAITWKSSSAKVASVTQKGLVTPLKAGNAKITASYKDGKKTISATVMVKVVAKVLPGNITINGPESVAVGKTAKFTAKIGAQTPAPSSKQIVWVSGDTSKATVNSSGVVTGKAATTSPVEIKACANDSLVNGKYTNCVSASLNVKTAAASVTIEVIDGTTTLDAGETVTLRAVVSPAKASQEVDWTAKSSKVASVTINTDGTVTVKAQAKGSINIKATTTDGTKKSDSVKLTVGVKVKDGMLSIKGAAATLAVKKSMKLTAVFNPVPSNKKVEWSILEGKNLITLKNGTVKATAPGHAKVQVCSVENTSVCAAAEFDVISPVTSVKFDQKKAQTLDIGGGSATLTLKVTVLPANATNRELEWKSSKPNVATVDENGKVTAKGVGSTVITAAATDGSKKSAKLTVKVVSKVQDDSLTIEGNTHELGLKQTTTLQVKFNQENAPTNQKVTWKSSAPKIASVSAKGVVKGLKEGDATITATSADNKNVKATWLIKVSVSGKSDAMLMDEMMQETVLPDIEALVDALLAETPTVEETEETITETAEPTAEETEEPALDETEIEQIPEAVEETGEDENITEEETTEQDESSEEEPVIVEIIENEDEIAVVYESEDADSLMTEESENGLDFGESLIGSEPVDVVIRDLGEYDALSGETGGVISLARDRFDLTDEVFSSLVFTVDDESVAKLTEQSGEAGIELQLLSAGETKLMIKQVSSGEVLREIRLVVTAAPAAEEPAEEESPAEEVLTESVEILESGDPTINEEDILVETDAELVFSNALEE